MSKKQTFEDKLRKKAPDQHCSVCDSSVQYVKQVKAVRADNGAWRYQERTVKVCKCNENEVYA